MAKSNGFLRIPDQILKKPTLESLKTREQSNQYTSDDHRNKQQFGGEISQRQESNSQKLLFENEKLNVLQVGRASCNNFFQSGTPFIKYSILKKAEV